MMKLKWVARVCIDVRYNHLLGRVKGFVRVASWGGRLFRGGSLSHAADAMTMAAVAATTRALVGRSIMRAGKVFAV